MEPRGRMSAYYKNSLVIDFTVVPARPKLDTVREFVFTQMGIDMSRIKNVQTRIIKAHVVIEVESAELAEELVTRHNMQHSVEHQGRQYPIPIYTADHIKEVRVYDLPCQMQNSVIVKHLTSFGEIISVRNDTWKDVFTGKINGTRIVRMKLHKPIPSYVMMSGELAFITYSGQTRTCKHCSLPLHLGKPCSQNRKDLIDSGLTTAQILQLAGKPDIPRQSQPADPNTPAGPSAAGDPNILGIIIPQGEPNNEPNASNQPGDSGHPGRPAEPIAPNATQDLPPTLNAVGGSEESSQNQSIPPNDDVSSQGEFSSDEEESQGSGDGEGSQHSPVPESQPKPGTSNGQPKDNTSIDQPRLTRSRDGSSGLQRSNSNAPSKRPAPNSPKQKHKHRKKKH